MFIHMKGPLTSLAHFVTAMGLWKSSFSWRQTLTSSRSSGAGLGKLSRPHRREFPLTFFQQPPADACNHVRELICDSSCESN